MKRTTLVFFSILAFCLPARAEEATIRALIIDGSNNHECRSSTDFLRAALEASGRFKVSVLTAPELKFPRSPRRTKRPEAEAILQCGE